MQLYIVHNSNNDNNSNTSQLLFVSCAKTVSNSLADPLKLREGSRAWPKFARCTARGRHRFRQILSHYLQLARDIALYYYVQMHNNMQVARVRWVTLLLSVLLLCHVRRRVLNTRYICTTMCKTVCIIRLNGRLLLCVYVFTVFIV